MNRQINNNFKELNAWVKEDMEKRVHVSIIFEKKGDKLNTDIALTGKAKNIAKALEILCEQLMESEILDK